MSYNNSTKYGAKFDPTVHTVASVYGYMLGGKDNFAADRWLAEQLLAEFPVSAGCGRPAARSAWHRPAGTLQRRGSSQPGPAQVLLGGRRGGGGFRFGG